MDKKNIEVLEKFVNERLSEAERKRAILVVNKKPLTWLQVIEELKKGGDFSREVEKELGELTK